MATKKDAAEVSAENINNYKQNKIKYIVEDFGKYNIAEELVRKILLARGFNKWIANRIKFIWLKNDLKEQITETLRELIKAKKDSHYFHVAKLKGELKILMSVREKIREICHSPRWQFPE